MAKVTLGPDLSLNIPRLIETRMLVQANSGGGKSYAIRKLLEETHGHVQQIVLDIEGEFATLREKYDYLLAGKGHDVPADPRSADLLARKTLELEVSLIVDLYELKQHERIRFVKNFLEAMINAPKELWHPVMVVIDEAHLFAPEKGNSEAMGAVIDLATRGRKRGFAAILATQRLSKLHKDAAAECQNKLIGRTSLDIDMKRAADELGFTSRDQLLSLRKLKPGEFFAFGPAISDEVTAAQIGEVKTTHPKAGHRLKAKAPVPTAKIKQLLAKLVDLPKEAEEELRDRESMRARIKELERELRTAQKEGPKVDTTEIHNKAYARGMSDGQRDATKAVDAAEKCLRAIRVGVEHLAKLVDVELPKIKAPTATKPSAPMSTRPAPARASAKVEVEGRTFGQCERKILGFLSIRPGEYFTKVQVGAMTGYSHGSGGFNNAISNLSQAGLIIRNGSGIALNTAADVSDLVDSTPHRLEDWIQKLGACERRIYERLLATPDDEISKESIATETGYSAGSGGFNNAISRLNTLGLIERRGGGMIALNSEVLRVS